MIVTQITLHADVSALLRVEMRRFARSLSPNDETLIDELERAALVLTDLDLINLAETVELSWGTLADICSEVGAEETEPVTRERWRTMRDLFTALNQAVA